MLTNQWAVKWIAGCATSIHDHRSELSQLDRVIGDGDHGENLARGFAAVAQRLQENTPDTPADVLRMVATTLMSTVGGASGPLYGTAFLRAAKAIEGRDLDSLAVVDLLTAARDGTIFRGKAAVGEKTMVDAWAPAVDAAREAYDQGLPPDQVLSAAATGAALGARATTILQARKGRASYLGERSVGHKDPGATSTALILEAASQAAKNGEVS